MSDFKNLTLEELESKKKSLEVYLEELKESMYEKGTQLHWLSYFIEKAGGEKYKPNQFAPIPMIILYENPRFYKFKKISN